MQHENKSYSSQNHHLVGTIHEKLKASIETESYRIIWPIKLEYMNFIRINSLELSWTCCWLNSW